MTAPATVHATALAFGEAGLLLRGASGAGKSTLAIALIARAPPDGFARLVADDRVVLSAAGGRVLARPPAPLAGLVEARGVGILPVAHLPAVRLSLVVDLVPPADVPRLPEGGDRAVVAGVALPRLALPARSVDVATVSLLTHLGVAGLTDQRTRTQRAPVAAGRGNPVPPAVRTDGRSM